jgi:hypothetical protein
MGVNSQCPRFNIVEGTAHDFNQRWRRHPRLFPRGGGVRVTCLAFRKVLDQYVGQLGSGGI